MEGELLQEYLERLGEKALKKRLGEQVRHAAVRLRPRPQLYWENIDLLPLAAKAGLTLTGLRGIAHRHSLDYRIETADLPLRGLDPALSGLRVLQLSDLHIDGLPEEGDAFFSALEGLEYDLCVLTGDYRLRTYGEHDRCIGLFLERH